MKTTNWKTRAKAALIRVQIHRSIVNRKVAGVCGGIGEWLGVDPTIVRLAWILLTLGWGTGVLLYAAFALALPVGISSVTETEK